MLEYAVVHELCHLKYRTHGSEFWDFLKTIMPDYQKRKTWLDKNENLAAINVGQDWL
ncbi:MAG: M48 family peptidase [Alphaproteobacteria bacterium PRO2]|nr:M48 family peptidase [Alphaproteobacteria bacterium PRO2]